MNLWQQNKKTQLTADNNSQFVNVLRVNENGIRFKILGNPFNTDGNDNPLPIHKIFGNFFKYTIDGKDYFVKRNTSGKQDKIFQLTRSLKKMLENRKDIKHPIHTAWSKEIENILQFLRVNCENLALVVLPDQADIKVLDIKNSILGTLFSDIFLNNMNSKGYGDFYDLGSPENNKTNGWLVATKTKTGTSYRDVKYHIDIVQGQEEIQLADGTVKKVLDAKKLSINPRIYELEETDIPDTRTIASQNIWTEEEEKVFVNCFNFPELSDYKNIPDEKKPTARQMIQASINALPVYHKNRILGIKEQPSIKQPVQEEVQQPVVEQPIVQQPVVQQPVVQQPVTKEVVQEKPVQQESNKVSDDEIEAMLNKNFDEIDF